MPARFRSALLAASMSLLTLASRPTCAAIPGQPKPADVKTIDICVADALSAKSDPDACVGRVSSICLATASTTVQKEECNNRELLVWQAALNRDYNRLMSLLADDNVKQALRDAERDFFVFELKQCTFDRIAHRDAPDALLTAARCNLRATARQALWLLDEIDSFQPH